MLTIEGIEWSLPILPARANKTEPTVDPTIIAIIASPKFEEEINEPAEITSSPMPKLDHNTKKFFPDNTLCLLSIGFIPKSELSSKNFTTISPRIIFIR
jgi:hypothetical protein